MLDNSLKNNKVEYKGTHPVDDARRVFMEQQKQTMKQARGSMIMGPMDF